MKEAVGTGVRMKAGIFWFRFADGMGFASGRKMKNGVDRLE